MDNKDFRSELLIKEMHHRIKNNIQLISCLLEIFAKEKENEVINEFVREINFRFQSMMELHNYLYSIDNSLEKINAQCYLENLVCQIASIHDIDKNNFCIEAKNVFLNSNNTLLIGLLVNELIINSIKHNLLINDSNKISIRIKNLSNKYSYFFQFHEINKIDFQNGNKFVFGGLKLIKLIIQQLENDILFDFNNELKKLINLN